jgi:Restriction endonuclease NotI
MKVAEVFGFAIEDQSTEAWASRDAKRCPFRETRCTKSSKTDPLGICSLSNGASAATLCPVRFLEGGRIFSDAARIAFGEDATFAVFPEIRILEIPHATDAERKTKIGKVDFLIGRIEAGRVADFAAIEIQAAYFSGASLRPFLDNFLKTHSSEGFETKRRPDFRSCAQKRLMPQLQLKIPVFRRWGKKFFVVIDSQFFGSLPAFSRTSSSNSELTWLSYPISANGVGYSLGAPEVVFSEWDEVQNSLREGRPPEPDDIIRELQAKLDGPIARRPVVVASSLPKRG